MTDKIHVDIEILLKQLHQQITDAEWNGEPFLHLKKEYDTIMAYYKKTGSKYYPLF